MQPTTDGPKKLIALGINSEGNFYMAFLGLAKRRIILGSCNINFEITELPEKTKGRKPKFKLRVN